jgi:hypothetical protein
MLVDPKEHRRRLNLIENLALGRRERSHRHEIIQACIKTALQLSIARSSGGLSN